MKVKLPKASKGYGFDELCRLEMNNFDVEEVLPPLFYLVVTKGRARARCPNDPKDIDGFVSRLAEHPRMSGFSSPQGKELLNRWVRATLIKTSTLGRSRVGDQIAYIVPWTLLSYKAGFPSENTRLRKVHTFLYEALVSALADMSATPSPGHVLEEIFREAFGRGILPAFPPRYDSSFDGTAGLDVNTLLSLYFLDGFAPTEIAAQRPSRVPARDRGPALPQTLSGMARGLLAYLTAYSKLLPVAALNRGLIALSNFFLLVYSLRLAYAANELLSTRRIPGAMVADGLSAPEIYVDFTRRRGSDSDELARWCVTRDLEEFRAYFKTAVTLRTIDRFATQNAKLHALLMEIDDAPAYLVALSKLQDDPAVAARSEAERELICDETLDSLGQGEQDGFNEWLSEEERIARTPLDVVVRLLIAAQSKSGVEAYMKWYSNVGGLKKPYGLLSGARRNSARYAMGDDLLAALVQVAMTEFEDGTPRAVAVRRIRLSDFIAYLAEKFGILVDRPPTLMDSALTRTAAAENLEEFKRRLRQMGYFQALSDDFTAQYLHSDVVDLAI